jgi:hypothetical protein
MHSKINGLLIEEAAHRVSENIHQQYTWQGINNHNMQGAQIINSLKINDPICLWTNELNKDF